MDENVDQFEEYEDIESYGKLQGPGWKRFLHKLIIFLGRDPDSEIPGNLEEQSIYIGDSQKISRRHARISWNDHKGQWEIQILSKNKAIINGIILRNGDGPMTLNPKSAIKIDKYKFYFFPATDI
jgi:hypothetical protein